MKREIICIDCANKSKKAKEYPDEKRLFINGKSLSNYLCDHCNKEIKLNTECVAYSVYTINNPYYQWEYNYIDIPLSDEIIEEQLFKFTQEGFDELTQE
jgi:hypothetical protein